jgi:hypothetical protein
MKARPRAVPLLVLLVILLSVPSIAQAQTPLVQNVIVSQVEQSLRIAGINFGATPPTVYLNFTPLTLLTSSPTVLTAQLPGDFPPGTYSLVIIAAGGTSFSQVTLGAAGTLSAPAVDTATALTAFPSTPLTLSASTLRSTTGDAIAQRFRWQVDPLNNNTATPSGRLALYFATDTLPFVATGLSFNSNGTINFAAGQTFPGGSGVTSVLAGTGIAVSGPAATPTVGIANNGVTNAQIADGTIQNGDIANGTIAEAKLNFDAATAADLSGHVKITRIGYTGTNTDSTISTTYESLRSIGNFTKARANSDILVFFQGQASRATSGYCAFQVRVDNNQESGGGGHGVVNSSEASLGVVAHFTGLATGSRGISIWVKGTAPSCTLNTLNLPFSVIVQETGG